MSKKHYLRLYLLNFYYFLFLINKLLASKPTHLFSTFALKKPTWHLCTTSSLFFFPLFPPPSTQKGVNGLRSWSLWLQQFSPLLLPPLLPSPLFLQRFPSRKRRRGANRKIMGGRTSTTLSWNAAIVGAVSPGCVSVWRGQTWVIWKFVSYHIRTL